MVVRNARLGIAALAIAGMVTLTIWACQTPPTEAKDFTPEHVAEIQNLLDELDEDAYRMVLPTFDDGSIVGSEVSGTLSVTEVRRMASEQNVDYVETGNLQAIFRTCSGGGAGSHTESQSPGSDIGQRIERILANIDESKYVFLR